MAIRKDIGTALDEFGRSSGIHCGILEIDFIELRITAARQNPRTSTSLTM